MNKTIISLAIFALINNTSAINIRDDDDLYTDDGQVADTLASIKSSEKQHGKTFNSLTQQESKDVVTQKTALNFDKDDDFLNSNKKYTSFIQIDSEISYKDPRPIGEMLAMMEPSESVSAILTGAGVNDDEDNAETMKSIKAAEKAVGGSMKTPSVDSKFFQ